MMRRAAFALAVLTATIYWADCGFSVRVPGPAEPVWNTFFAGCFRGQTTGPSGSGEVIIVLEAKAEDRYLLGGCIQLMPGTTTVTNGTLAGEIREARHQAGVTVTPTSGAMFTLLVERNPAGEVNATTLTLTDEGGAPFASAANLQICQTTCPMLSTRMPFRPEGGGQ
jgi:hypothetical protein